MIFRRGEGELTIHENCNVSSSDFVPLYYF